MFVVMQYSNTEKNSVAPPQHFCGIFKYNSLMEQDANKFTAQPLVIKALRKFLYLHLLIFRTGVDLFALTFKGNKRIGK